MARPRSPGPQESLGPLIRNCKQAVSNVLELQKAATMYEQECTRLAKFAKRLLPLFEDIEDGASTIQGVAVMRCANSMKEVLQALQRCEAIMSQCSTMGPFMAALQEEDTVAEFVDAVCDLSEALGALNLEELKVDPDQAEGMQLTLQQLQRITVSAVSAGAHECVQQVKALCEEVRNGTKKGPSLSDAPLLEERVSKCSVAQVAADAEFCRERLQQAKQKRKHVEVWVFQLVLDLEQPLLPKDAKSARMMSNQRVLVLDKPVHAPEVQEDTEPGEAVDPVPIVQQLLDAVFQPNASLEQRLQALQPLVAAVGLAPSVADSSLHHGAVMFAMTDTECNQKVVSLLRERSTEPFIKGWLLALLLSLIHPVKGLNPRTQQALMDADLVSVLCRLLSASTTDGTQKLQCLHMLRVLVHDPSTHDAIVQAKAVNVIVQQVSPVVVSKGHVHDLKRAPPSSSITQSPQGTPMQQQQQQQQAKQQQLRKLQQQQQQEGKEGGAELDMDQQRVQLAVLMLMDLAPGPHKAEVLRTGGVLALVQRLSDPTSHERVLEAAADTLAVLFDDGSIAVQASRYDALAVLTDLAASPTSSASLRACMLRAITVMLTPSPPSTAGTAEAVLAAARARVLSLPPQGKGARMARPGEHAGAGAQRSPQKPAQPPHQALQQQQQQQRNAALRASHAHDGKEQQQEGGGGAMSAEELFLEMGRTLSPRSTTALMTLLEMATTPDLEEIRLLVLKFLPLTATDAACRAAIINHGGGLPSLLRAAGRRHAAAICALRRVAVDYKLKGKCASTIAEALVDACSRGGTEERASASNLALALASVSIMPPGSEKDRAAVAAQQAFMAEVVSAGGVQPLAVLLKSSTDMFSQRASLLALRQLVMYGNEQVKSAILAEDALSFFVDAVKREESEWPQPPPRDDGFDRDLPPEPEVCQAACEILAGLASEPEVRRQVLALLAPLLTQPPMARACRAMVAVAGSDPGAHDSLVQPALLQLIHILRTAQSDQLTQPTRLFAAMVAHSARAADAAANPARLQSASSSSAKGTAKQSSSGPAPQSAPPGACHKDCLPRVLGLAAEAVAREAAAAAVGHLVKRDAQARDELASSGGLKLLLDVTQAMSSDSPYFVDACAGVAAMASLHEHSKQEVVRAIRQSLLSKGAGPATSAAAGARVCKALSHSPHGRELLFAEELLDGLIKALSLSDAPDAQCFAADALTHATSSGPILRASAPSSTQSNRHSSASMQQQQQQQQQQQHMMAVGASPKKGAQAQGNVLAPKPRLVIVNKGAVGPLLQMLSSPLERVVYEASFALENIASLDEGSLAIQRADGARHLNEVVKRAKEGKLSQRTKQAAYAAYVKVM